MCPRVAYLYLLYTSDLPSFPGVEVATFTDDTALVAPHSDCNIATTILQKATDTLATWNALWKIRFNPSKSVRVNFSLRQHNYNPTVLNGEDVPMTSHTRYFGLHFDQTLTWRDVLAISIEVFNFTILPKTSLFDYTATSIDPWYSSVGLYIGQQLPAHPKFPKQSGKNHHRCSMVCQYSTVPLRSPSYKYNTNMIQIY